MLGDKQSEFGLEIIGLGAQHLDSSGRCPQGSHRASMLDAVFGENAKPGTAFHLYVELVTPELVPQLRRGVDDQCLQMAESAAPGAHCALSSTQKNPNCLSNASTSGLSEMATGECFPSCPIGIEDIGLCAVATCRTLRTVDLDDPFSLLEEEGGESRSEAARALDGPAPTTRIPCSLLGPGEHSFVAKGVCGERHVFDFGPGRGNKTEGMGLLVSIDSNDEVDVFGKVHALPP